MRKRIGDILVEMGFIDSDQLDTALVESKKAGTMIGDVLLRLDWITEEQLQMAVAVQSGAKIFNPKLQDIDKSLINDIPHEFARSHDVFPILKTNDTLMVATANPFDVVTKDQLARMTGTRVESMIAPKKWVNDAIEFYYETAGIIDNDIDEITHLGVVEETLGDNRTVRLADLLIEKGRLLGASDIHIVPDVTMVRIYYRIDGVLHQEYLFPIKFHPGLVSRYKIMGDMDISNPNIPHDGRIKYKSRVGDLDLRVSTFPTHLGEVVVLRLLIYSSVIGDLKELGFEEEDYIRFSQHLKKPYGLIISTGPTGSGKTTTLYSALMAIKNPSVSVLTIEDPIEYMIPTIRQTSVNPKAGLTFGNALRSAMRQDPDIILIGEIRDQETAELALRSSITGHLVLSTLHTNDAASAINRLMDLGVNASMLAASLSMVAAQRLLRKTCTRCMTVEPIKAEEKQIFLKNDLEPPEEIPRANGCEACHRSGYKGRSGIYEILEMNQRIEELIFAGALRGKIEEAVVASGTHLLQKQALKKVKDGITSLEEVFRVVAYA